MRYWAYETYDSVFWLALQSSAGSPPYNYPIPHPAPSIVYYEIGNEPNNNSMYANGANDYGVDYAFGAAGVHAVYEQGPVTNYKILTAGVLDPTSDWGQNGTVCVDSSNTINIFNDAYIGLYIAETYFQVPSSQLAVAVHPYHYNTQNFDPTVSGYWRNYYGFYGNSYAGDCGDLQEMINLWTGLSVPVMFTEDNWSDSPDNPLNQCAFLLHGQKYGCEGAYLADLFTYMTDQGYTNLTNSPLRVMWYRGTDETKPPPPPTPHDAGWDLGIYYNNDNGGGDKSIYLGYCSHGLGQTYSNISYDYFDLGTYSLQTGQGGCY